MFYTQNTHTLTHTNTTVHTHTYLCTDPYTHTHTHTQTHTHTDLLTTVIQSFLKTTLVKSISVLNITMTFRSSNSTYRLNQQPSDHNQIDMPTHANFHETI